MNNLREGVESCFLQVTNQAIYPWLPTCRCLYSYPSIYLTNLVYLCVKMPTSTNTRPCGHIPNTNVQKPAACLDSHHANCTASTSNMWLWVSGWHPQEHPPLPHLQPMAKTRTATCRHAVPWVVVSVEALAVPVELSPQRRLRSYALAMLSYAGLLLFRAIFCSMMVGICRYTSQRSSLIAAQLCRGSRGKPSYDPAMAGYTLLMFFPHAEQRVWWSHWGAGLSAGSFEAPGSRS